MGAKKIAASLGVTGYVQNNADKTVTIEAEGEGNAIEDLIEWCRHGSGAARVDRVEIEEGGMQYFDTFQVN